MWKQSYFCLVFIFSVWKNCISWKCFKWKEIWAHMIHVLSDSVCFFIDFTLFHTRTLPWKTHPCQAAVTRAAGLRSSDTRTTGCSTPAAEISALFDAKPLQHEYEFNGTSSFEMIEFSNQTLSEQVLESRMDFLLGPGSANAANGSLREWYHQHLHQISSCHQLAWAQTWRWLLS